MWLHIYNGILLSHKKNETLPSAATWMDPENITLNELSQIQILYHLNMESKKIIQMNLFTKWKQIHRHRKQTYGYQRRKGNREK